MSMEGFTTLKCECGSDIFVDAIRIQYHPNSGTTNKPAGKMCVACHLYADMEYLISRVKVEKKRAEIKEAEEEVKNLQQTQSKAPGAPEAKQQSQIFNRPVV